MKNCLECHTSIQGRSDKKFCDDACRNSYHNRINQKQNSLTRKVHQTLKKNYRILVSIMAEHKKSKTTKDQLTSLGYQFDFLTHIKAHRNGNFSYWVYNYGYKVLDDKFILIIKKDS